ncbi:hypothetical protein ACU686_21720 [Yinghuangia aomiensis]
MAGVLEFRTDLFTPCGAEALAGLAGSASCVLSPPSRDTDWAGRRVLLDGEADRLLPARAVHWKRGPHAAKRRTSSRAHRGLHEQHHFRQPCPLRCMGGARARALDFDRDWLPRKSHGK